jgi:hypothetical protein
MLGPKKFVRRLACSIFLIVASANSNISISHAVLSLPTPTCNNGSCTVSLTNTSDYYQWTVPNGITSVVITTIGGSGGTGFYQTARPPGGFGARLVDTITVTSGDQLYFYVGSSGGNAISSASAAAGTNTAGSSGSRGVFSGAISGGGGGAASEVRLNGTAVSNRVIVAGGGGGGGSGCGTTSSADQNNDAGGSASGNTGGTGLCIGWASTNGGSGGTLLADGNGGPNRTGRTASITGGGGGGGYFGGGAGNQGGGGAGSSWIDATRVQGTFASASTIGNGSITFTYAAPTLLTLGTSGGVMNSYRTPGNITATTNLDGYVTFLANGKRISGCNKVQTISLNAICSFKPATHGPIQITALLYALRSDASPISTLISNSAGTARSNKR